VSRLRFLSLLLPLLALARAGFAQQCDCDPARPETLLARQCSLCAEAEKQPPGVEFFILKDSNPRKPGRWLVLPRLHTPGTHDLASLPKSVRVRLWQRAIAFGKEKFGDGYGVAYNGPKVRTQCHMHVHVGRFITAAENSRFRLVRRVEDFPAPTDGGVFIHPVPGGFHVHTGEDIMETSLVR
jgi:diadenosine tetraphosphate (Ap4A) HIT family hydrolase